MRIAAAVAAGVLVVSLTHAQVISQVKYFPHERFINAAVDGTGGYAYSVVTTNPGYVGQIVRFDAVTGAAVQLTSFAAGVRMVSVTDDGQWLAFISDADLTGGNNDESSELFVMHPNGTGL